ncbi:MAG: GNAT family N-acetyltransferase [Candidatus Magasanikbacteria bacterium]
MSMITKATTKNYSELLKLSKLLDEFEPQKEAEIKKALDSNLIWIVKDDDKIAGYCLIELFDSNHDQLPNSIFISELYVVEPYRQKGIGKELVQKILNSHFPVQYTYFSLSHDPEEKHLTDFYKSFGFEVVGKTKGGNVKMIKNI